MDLRSTTLEIEAAGGTRLEPGCGLDNFRMELDAWFETECPVFQLLRATSMTCVGGVIIDRHEILKYMDSGLLDTVEQEDAPARMTLAHERTHWQQLQDLGVDAFETAYMAKKTLMELEADFIAAAFIGRSLQTTDINFLPLVPFAIELGKPDWKPNEHPHPGSRAWAVCIGLNFGAAKNPTANEAKTEANKVAIHLENVANEVAKRETK